MSDQGLATYLNEEMLPYPFCPGCGHGPILDQLNEALVELQLDPRRVVIVTDIGCCGLSDRFFDTNAFHGLHGRSVTYASGIKLASGSVRVVISRSSASDTSGISQCCSRQARSIFGNPEPDFSPRPSI